MRVLVVAPHPDDESLGCGGSLLRLRAEQPEADVHWMIVTDMTTRSHYSAEQIARRESEILTVADRLGVSATHRLGFPAAGLDAVAMQDVVGEITTVIRSVQPDTTLVPFGGDVHSDHRVVFNAMVACTKTFRAPSIKRMLTYETISETELALNPTMRSFQPNVWVDISNFLEQKLDLLDCYPGEMGEFPFPRSREAVAALARYRGSGAGMEAAEAFMLLKAIV